LAAQHALMGRMNIVHKNLTLNIGVGKSKILEYGLGKEESLRMMNRPAWLRQCTWIGEQLGEAGAAIGRAAGAGNLAECLRQLEYLAAERQTPEHRQLVALAIESIKWQLTEADRAAYQDAYPDGPSAAICRSSAYPSVLARQRDLHGPSRMQELMTHALLERSLGVLRLRSCKSGCDRTGLQDAAEAALEQLLATHPPQEVFNVVMRWDHFHQQLIRGSDRVGSADRFAGLVGGWPAGSPLRIASEYQNAVARHMVEVGIGVNYFSTGITGFKYNSGSDENPHPAYILPPWIQVAGQAIQLVRWNAESRRPELTPEGHAWLTDASKMRGT